MPSPGLHVCSASDTELLGHVAKHEPCHLGLQSSGIQVTANALPLPSHLSGAHRCSDSVASWGPQPARPPSLLLRGGAPEETGKGEGPPPPEAFTVCWWPAWWPSMAPVLGFPTFPVAVQSVPHGSSCPLRGRQAPVPPDPSAGTPTARPARPLSIPSYHHSCPHQSLFSKLPPSEGVSHPA